jgi:hypothetical protein
VQNARNQFACQQEVWVGFLTDEILHKDPGDVFLNLEEEIWFDRFIQKKQVFDPIEDGKTTGEIRYNLNNLQTKKNFIEYINCSVDNSESFDFNPIIKRNLNN